jgi:pimeloyl-ACP methyl ester carboxylesterase
MKKFLITLLFLSSLFSYPYKPKPILFVHGFMGNSGNWGVKIADYCIIPRCDTIEKDSIIQGSTFDVFLQKMIPYVYAWWIYDTSYTRPEDTLFPNKSFLEIINFNDPSGSLDPDTANYPKPFKGQGDELVERIRSILNEYYGNNWENNPDAKVILIAHSQGGVVIREALKEDTTLIPHIAKIITLTTPHLGTILANLGVRDWMILSLFGWHPLVHPIKWGAREGLKWLGERLPDWLVNLVSVDLKNHTIKIGGKFVINLNGDAIAMKIIENMPSALFEIPGLGEYLVAFAVLEGIIGPGIDLIAEALGKEGIHVVIGSVPDLRENSTFITNLGTYGAGRISFVCILSRGFYDDNEFCFHLPFPPLNVTWADIGALNRWCLGLTAAYWTAAIFYPKPFLEWAIKSTISEGMWEWWNQNSDLMVRWGSQSVNHVSDDFNAREIKKWGIYHGHILKKYDLIFQALEERPLIDSVILIQSFIDSSGDTIIDTTYLSENKIDTIITSFENLRIEGKLKKTYFLDISAPKIWLNDIYLGKLKYPENCGYEDRKFFIDSTYLKYIGAGYNKLKISSKNIVGEEFTRNYTLWMVPSGWFCMQENPFYREVLPNLPINDTFKIRLIKLGVSDSLKKIKWDSLKINFVRIIKDTNGWFMPNPEDTQYVLIPKNLYFYEDVEGEFNDTNYLLCPGKRLNLPFLNLKNFLIDTFNIKNFEGIYNFYYAVNDSFKRVNSFHIFYIDETPPVIEIIGPEGVYSKNINDSIAIIAKIKDNFEIENQTPKSLKWSLKKESGEEIYSKYYDEPGFYYYEDLFIDFIRKDVLGGIEDGKYFVEIKVKDRG